MEMQNFEKKRQAIIESFKSNLSLRTEQLPELKLAWSNWGFGMEPLERSAARLQKNGIEWIELHGNRYGQDIGYRSKDVLAALGDFGIRVSGVCGMFGQENDLSSNSGAARQRALDYIKRQIELCVETGGSYLLVVPGAVGRPAAYDESEFARSAATLKLVAEDFLKAGVRAAIEPIRSAEVSIVHTVSEAKRYIEAVGHEGVAHINGDVYHMQAEEPNIAEAIIEAGEQLVNLHLADSNRCALGRGSLDLDAVIMALYVIDFQDGARFATPEPLGPGGDPYPAMHGRPDENTLDSLVSDTVSYWREREAAVRARAAADAATSG